MTNKTSSVKQKEYLKKLGKAIRLHRQAKDLKQKELAGKVGISANYLSLVERGEKSASFDTLVKIAEALDTKLHVLFLRAEFPELGDRLARVYYLTQILEETEFDELKEITERLRKEAAVS